MPVEIELLAMLNMQLNKLCIYILQKWLRRYADVCAGMLVVAGAKSVF